MNTTPAPLGSDVESTQTVPSELEQIVKEQTDAPLLIAKGTEFLKQIRASRLDISISKHSCEKIARATSPQMWLHVGATKNGKIIVALTCGEHKACAMLCHRGVTTAADVLELIESVADQIGLRTEYENAGRLARPKPLDRASTPTLLKRICRRKRAHPAPSSLRRVAQHPPKSGPSKTMGVAVPFK